jgi:hypothetical protein
LVEKIVGIVQTDRVAREICDAMAIRTHFANERATEWEDGTDEAYLEKKACKKLTRSETALLHGLYEMKKSTPHT